MAADLEGRDDGVTLPRLLVDVAERVLHQIVDLLEGLRVLYVYMQNIVVFILLLRGHIALHLRHVLVSMHILLLIEFHLNLAIGRLLSCTRCIIRINLCHGLHLLNPVQLIVLLHDHLLLDLLEQYLGLLLSSLSCSPQLLYVLDTVLHWLLLLLHTCSIVVLHHLQRYSLIVLQTIWCTANWILNREVLGPLRLKLWLHLRTHGLRHHILVAVVDDEGLVGRAVLIRSSVLVCLGKMSWIDAVGKLIHFILIQIII